MLFSAGCSPLLARSLILKRLGGVSSQSVGVTALSRGSAAATPSCTTNSAPSSSSSTAVICCRWYITRAHPAPTPVLAVPQALEETLGGARLRRRRRDRKWKRNEAAKKPMEQKSATAATSHPDETIDLALNLNLDPRKPGQSLRGSISLPNGTGKKLACLVFTKDPEAQKRALAMGARHAGGESLVRAILQRGTGGGTNTTDDAPGSSNEDAADQEDSDMVISIDSLDRVLASQDMIPILTKTLARLLGPRGLMPNAKTGTVFSTSESLLESLETQIAGKEVVYRTERAGVVHVPIGKHSFGIDKLLENIGQVMVEIYKVKPEQYGKQQASKKNKSSSSSSSSKASKHAKYLLSAYLSATQGKSIKVDLRTLDPNSSFFLRAVEAPGAAAAAVKKEQAHLLAAAAAAETTQTTMPPSVESSSSSTTATAEQVQL